MKTSLCCFTACQINDIVTRGTVWSAFLQTKLHQHDFTKVTPDRGDNILHEVWYLIATIKGPNWAWRRRQNFLSISL